MHGLSWSLSPCCDEAVRWPLWTVTCSIHCFYVRPAWITPHTHQGHFTSSFYVHESLLQGVFCFVLFFFLFEIWIILDKTVLFPKILFLFFFVFFFAQEPTLTVQAQFRPPPSPTLSLGLYRLPVSVSLWCKLHSDFVFCIFSLLSPFLCLKPLMLSVVNGLASCFKAAIAECKFWLLRFIYTGILKLIVYISSRHGMTQCKQKVEIIKKKLWVLCSPHLSIL